MSDFISHVLVLICGVVIGFFVGLAKQEIEESKFDSIYFTYQTGAEEKLGLLKSLKKKEEEEELFVKKLARVSGEHDIWNVNGHLYFFMERTNLFEHQASWTHGEICPCREKESAPLKLTKKE